MQPDAIRTLCVRGMRRSINGCGRCPPEAAPGSVRAFPTAGDLVTETFDHDGGRQIVVYRRRICPRRLCSPVEGISQWVSTSGLPMYLPR